MRNCCGLIPDLALAGKLFMKKGDSYSNLLHWVVYNNAIQSNKPVQIVKIVVKT